MGIIPPLSGTFSFHIAARPAYLEQDLKFREQDTNAFNYISDCFPRFNQKEIRSQLARVGIKGEMSLQNVKTLSGALGHYSAGFTLTTYTHATAEMKRDAADTIGNVISQAM